MDLKQIIEAFNAASFQIENVYRYTVPAGKKGRQKYGFANRQSGCALAIISLWRTPGRLSRCRTFNPTLG